MIKITERQLTKLGACSNGIEWFKNQKIRKLDPLINSLLEDNHPDYARWLLSHLMTHSQKIQWAIYSAEQVIKVYEKSYPKDDRPRKAIQAARNFLEGKIDAYAAYAAANAAYAAANAAYAAANAAANAAYAAANAAYAAANAAANAAAYAAANAAANAAAYAAYAAAYAAANAAANAAAYAAANAAAYAAAYAANAARAKLTHKIMAYGLWLLGEGGRPC